MSKMYIDQVEAPIDNIPAPDRLDDPNNLDLLAKFIYKVPEYLSGGLHYSSYQEKMDLEATGYQLNSSRAIEAQVGRN